jgi:hypothetical protein
MNLPKSNDDTSVWTPLSIANIAVLLTLKQEKYF